MPLPNRGGRVGRPRGGNRLRGMSQRGGMPYLRGGRAPRRGIWSNRQHVPLFAPYRIRRAAILFALIGLISLLFTTGAGLESKREVELFDMNPLDSTSLMVSTPRNSWQQGQMPYLYQTDPLWSTKPYGGGTVRVNGCGPTCLSMVYIYLTGDTSLDPGQMSAYADQGNYAPTGATEWSFMTRGAAGIGITGQAISPDVATVTSALEAGRPVICAMRPGDFTTVGHYIVLAGIDERGMVEVHDPNSQLRSAQGWRLDWVLGQATNSWAFSA